jgi:signal transduction histidine kinase
MEAPTSPSEPSVLIVDDSPANLVALGALLNPLGVRVVEAKSGAEALDRVAAEAFAVVLLDVQMPGMDGFEVARRLRTMESGRDLPIIFLTAIHRDEKYSREGYASGGTDYITKPFDADVLLARVKGFIGLFRQRENLRHKEVSQRTRERDDAMQQLASLLESERAARRDAEIANNAKDEFLATVSHELRTPLHSILGWTTIARRLSPSAEIDRALATIERSARAQARIIEDVLDTARIISGKLRLEITTAKVADAIGGAVQAVRPSADAKGVRLEVNLNGPIGVISADPDRLQQIVWNLLSNAIKFTPKGGRVEVSATPVNSDIRICVSDTGQGIRPGFLPYLFEPFRQADGSTTRRHGGLGLGLAIVKQLVSAHGGTVVAHSAGEGHGSAFTVELPGCQAPGIPDEQPSGSRHNKVLDAPSGGARLDGLRVLVVDDEEDARLLVHRLLTDQGATVRCAQSAEEALGALQTTRPDVLVSDIGMPVVDGYMMIRRIRCLPPEHGGRTPAIALTAYAREEDGERAFAAGFQAHVSKPVEPWKIISLVANLGGVSLGSAPSSAFR